MNSDDNAWIALRSGGRFYFKDLPRSTFTIEDIACGLSLEVRFSGQAGEYYVGEHLCHSCDLAEKEQPGTELEHLLHDAQEFALKDVTSPLKSLLPEYKILEDAAHAHICRTYGADPHFSYKRIDTIMVVHEARLMFKNGVDWLDSLPYSEVKLRSDIKIEGWRPERVREEFLKRFNKFRRNDAE